MLEVSRILATGSYILSNDLVFLFNGAEESLLLSSHAFITQHSWADDIVAFMNLEGAGAGKRLLLFQTGPGQSSEVLLDAYANSFRQPYASIFGEDVFQFGLIPSDTDYRIFRDYGLVPGLDLAYVNDGFAYHTPYDTESRISHRCLEQSGNNILRFILFITNDNRIQNITKLTPINYTSESLQSISSSDSRSDMKSVPPLVTTPATHRQVYFDLFGVTVIVVPWKIWKVANYVLCFYLCLLIFKTRGFGIVKWRGIFVALILHVITVLLGFGFSLTLGLLYHHYGCKMAWYSNYYNILGMFLLPIVWWFVWSQTYFFRIPGGLLFRLLNISNFFLGIWRYNALHNSYLLEIDFFDSGAFLLTVLLFIMSSVNATTSFIYTFWLIFALIFRVFNIKKKSSLESKVRQMIGFLVFVFVMTIHVYNCCSFFEVIIPIMGRAGHLLKPDLLISGSLFLMMLPVVFLFLGRLQCTSRTSSKSLRLMLLNACLSYVILIHASNYGFPYSLQSSSDFSDPLVSPRYQRLALFHTNRYLRHTPDLSEVTEKDSHILLVPLDANGIQYLKPNSYPMSSASFITPKEHTQTNFRGIKELIGAKPIQCNYSQPYCGIASAYPLLHVFKYIYRIPVEFHKAEPQVKLKLVSRTLLKNYLADGRLRWNLTFSVMGGPPHTHALIRTDGNLTKLTSWSFTSTAIYPSSMPLPPLLNKETASHKAPKAYLDVASQSDKMCENQIGIRNWHFIQMSNGFVRQSAESDCDWEVHDPFKNFKFTWYLKEEVVQSIRKKQDEDGTNKQGPFTNRAYTFITVPQYLESFMLYGLLQCLDHLLIVYTFLPLRCFLTVLNLLMRIGSRIFQFCTHLDLDHEIRCSNLHQSVYCTIMNYYDSSVAYHEIRTQSVIKIYIFFNLLEVADRLLSAVCQDALDDLLYTVSKPRSDMTSSSDSVESGFIFLRDIVLQYCFAFVCLIGHCFCLLCQVTTLNVAFNSQNKSLVTVFISNNFVELKGNVFRKMGKTNLFQIACADVRERFHYCVWLFIIVGRNMNENGWNLDDLQTILIDVACILLAEVAVDWVKHSFITKFNVIPSNLTLSVWLGGVHNIYSIHLM
ncbi:unnamed protein product [Heterobilharzia americana]|nr:unnamed protein product [Heterobilharzia americana]